MTELVTLKPEEINASPEHNIRGESKADEDLLASVKALGILEPVLVRESDRRLVVGFRRLDAAKRAGLAWIHAVLGEWTDDEIVSLQLVENLQRKDLGPMEEARAIARLRDAGWKQEEIAERLGYSQPWVANRLRLLELPQRAQTGIDEGKISAKHAEKILTLRTPELRKEFAKQMVSQGGSVDSYEYELKRARRVEDVFAVAKVTKCPDCGTDHDVLNTDSWGVDLARKQLKCRKCGDEFNVETGRIADHGWNCPKRKQEVQRSSVERRAETVKTEKALQVEAPFVRSAFTPREWLEALLAELEDEDLLRVDFDRYRPNRWFESDSWEVRLHFDKRISLPFQGRIRAVPYATGDRAQILLGADAVDPWGRYYNARNVAKKLPELKDTALAWQKAALGDGRETKTAPPADVSVLEGMVEEITKSVASSKKGRPSELSLLEWLEALREAETTGKNRVGVVEYLDQRIKDVGDKV